MPDEFIAAVTELLLRAGVQHDDIAALVNHHHRIRRCLKQPAVTVFHLHQLCFRRLADGNVADCHCHQNGAVALERAKHDFDGKLVATLSPSDEFDARPDLLRQRFGGRAQGISEQALGKSFRNDVADLPTRKLRTGPAEKIHCPGVEQYDFTGTVDNYHGIRRRLEKVFENGILEHKSRSGLLPAAVAIKNPQMRGLDLSPNADPQERQLRSWLRPLHTITAKILAYISTMRHAQSTLFVI
ncbi:MAG: hypothetical protein Q8M53_07295 [Burkholderiales bacterium]|nr:hypothetical protein [Burkholderiales bacterium]